MEETIPYNMKLPTLPIINGEGDPRDHTSRFTAIIGLLSVSDAILCRVFPTTLTGTAQRRYNKFKPRSIKNFASLSTKFLNIYLTNILAKTTISILRSCIQKEGDTLRSYIERFNKQAMKIDNLNVDIPTEALRDGARFEKLVDKLLVNKPITFSNLMVIAQNYFELDKGWRAIRGKEEKEKESKNRLKSRSEDRRPRPEENRRFAPQCRYEPRHDPRDDEPNFTPLNTSMTNVLMDKGEKRDMDDKGKEKEEERPSKILKTIHMINGGGHNSSTIRRKQRREVMNTRETHMPPVIFDVEDYEHVKAPHNDAL
ncbi:uncharacterized protein LOC126668197 [Mercurialis annua]|uniref:uncharacterized protein LOC126668197 n=1 Tax=Mercurialis annua TaxID=3986 RepID=UPI00215EA447|nr:uncharacterized protein LOC126668197 [Mercurialis annua]